MWRQSESKTPSPWRQVLLHPTQSQTQPASFRPCSPQATQGCLPCLRAGFSGNRWGGGRWNRHSQPAPLGGGATILGSQWHGRKGLSSPDLVRIRPAEDSWRSSCANRVCVTPCKAHCSTPRTEHLPHQNQTTQNQLQLTTAQRQRNHQGWGHRQERHLFSHVTVQVTQQANNKNSGQLRDAHATEYNSSMSSDTWKLALTHPNPRRSLLCLMCSLAAPGGPL